MIELLTVVAIFVVGGSWTLWSMRRKKADWDTAAAMMGLDLDDGAEPPRMSGRLRGFDVSIWQEKFDGGHGLNRSTDTIFDVRFASSGPPVTVTVAHWADGRAARRSVDHEIGDSEFDRRFRVAAEAVEDAVAFVTPLRKEAILAVAEAERGNTEMEIRTDGIRWTEGAWTPDDAEAIVKQLHTLVDTAEILRDEDRIERSSPGVVAADVQQHSKHANAARSPSSPGSPRSSCSLR